MIYYKATRPDGMSFYDGTTKWQVGRIVEHPAPDLSRGLCSPGVLHISDAPCETLLGFSWPCRLFEVEPRGEVIGPNGHKYGCTAVKVVRELPAWMALGIEETQIRQSFPFVLNRELPDDLSIEERNLLNLYEDQ